MDACDGVTKGPYVTSKSATNCFSELPANTDATLTLEVNAGDGDADLYVYGPKYASATSGAPGADQVYDGESPITPWMSTWST